MLDPMTPERAMVLPLESPDDDYPSMRPGDVDSDPGAGPLVFYQLERCGRLLLTRDPVGRVVVHF